MGKAQRGFGSLAALIISALIIVIALAGWFAYRAKFGQSSVGSISTLTGTVTAGPTSPVARPGDSGVSPVASHIIEAVNSQGKMVSSAKTDLKGHYELRLPPGHYTLMLTPTIGVGVVKDNAVDVTPGANSLDLSADTGIR